MKRKLLFTAIAIIGFATATMAQLPSYVPSNGLVGWWPFTGNANDISGNAHNGTVNGATLTTDRFGNANSAYSFNGLNNWINMPSGNTTSINITGNYTLTFWFKTTQGTNAGLIGFGDNINGNGGFLAAIGNGTAGNPQGKLTVMMANTWRNGSLILTDNNWHFICVKLNGTNLDFIIDNLIDTSFNNALAPTSFNGLRAIGSRNDGLAKYFNGLIDDIGLWNRALTQQEITALYQGSNNNNVPAYVPSNGLVGYWPFTGNANDVSGNGNNGTVNGATLTTDRYGNTYAAYSFDGNTSFINVLESSQLLLQDNFSVAVWIKHYGNPFIGTGEIIIAKSVGSCDIELSLRSFNTAVLAKQSCNNVISSNTFNMTNWNYLVITYVNSVAKIYLNGSLNNSATTSTFGNTLASIYFGKSSVNDAYFNGKIDDIGIWNRALTQAEITALYQGCNLSVSNPSNQNVNLGSNAQFITTTTNPSASYQWQTDLGLGFQNISNAGQYNGATNDTLIVSNTQLSNNNQQFRCIVNDGGCKDTSNAATLTIANIGVNETNQNQFKVYPNPASSQINVEIIQSLIGSSFAITDQIGKTVLSGKLNAEKSTIEIGDLSGGIYLFSIGNNAKQTFKVIKK